MFRQVGAGQSRGLAGDHLQVDVADRLVADVDAEICSRARTSGGAT